MPCRGFTGPPGGWARPDLMGLVCLAATSGRLPPLAVEVVPSRAAAVRLPSVYLFFTSVLQPHVVCLDETTMVIPGLWWRLLAGGWSGGDEASSSSAPMLQIVWGCG